MAIRINNYTVQITTAVAVFEMSRPIQDNPDMVNYIATCLANEHKGNVTIYLNCECKAHYDFFDEPVTPAVWTHTPLPIGMDAAALKAKFEERAAAVLGDYDSPVNLAKSNETFSAIKDNRYYDPTVRSAWMLYVDQAIEHFVSE